MKAWKQQAAELLNAKHCSDYLDWVNEDGDCSRYDLQSKRLVVGNADGMIKTYFPLDKSRLKYFIPEKLLAKIPHKK